MTAPVPISEGGLLPSYEAACDLYRGDPTAIWRVGLGWASRAAVIAIALVLSGERKRVIRTSLVASIGVEVFVLGWIWWNSRNMNRRRG